MARPKKNEEAEAVISTEETVQPAVTEMKEVALSYYCLNGVWEVVKIPFDAATGKIGAIQKLEPCDSSVAALNMFKMNVATNLMKRIT